mgnify:FL=1
MKVDYLNLKQKELETIYKILKEYEKTSNSNEESYDNYDSGNEKPIDKKIVLSILKNIGTWISQESKKEIDEIFLRKKYHTFNNEIDENSYATLERAFKQFKTVEIAYFDMKTAEFNKRKLDIYYKSRKYIIGYCHLRKGIRKFRTSRIASVNTTNLHYRIPQHFDKNDY